eukprot:3640163-Rhodomonas_salina.1
MERKRSAALQQPARLDCHPAARTSTRRLLRVRLRTLSSVSSICCVKRPRCLQSAVRALLNACVGRGNAFRIQAFNLAICTQGCDHARLR